MDTTRLVDSLDRFAGVMLALVAGLREEDARWRPDDGAWSILEIVRHLGDEEVDDFRRRVESTLRDPAAPWPPIDPEGWARERRYNEGALAPAVVRFIEERGESVRRLRALAAPDWDRAYDHARFGPIRAGDLLAAWAAHDALHLRQIARRLHQLAARDGAPYATDYAGSW